MFQEELVFTLTLKINGVTYTVYPGHVKNVEVQLSNYGFDAYVDFWTNEEKDEIFTSFVTQNLIEADLYIKGYYNLPTPPPEPLRLSGIVYDKALFEETYKEKQDTPVLYRRYTIHFSDPAYVLWKQHFPCELFVDKSMKDVINAQKPSNVTLQYDWSANLDTTYPIHCLSLGGRTNTASFYDLLMWYISHHDGVWNYDSSQNSYKISASKATGTAVELYRDEVEKVEVVFPEVVRHNVRVLNSYTEASKTQEIKQDYRVNGLNKDVLYTTSVNSHFTERTTLEEQKLKIREAELQITFKNFPTITFRPGTFIKCEGEKWPTTSFMKSKQYRVYEIYLRATAQDPSPMSDKYRDLSRYDIQMVAKAENKDDKHVNMSVFQVPHYPIYVEGKIVSEQEADEKETYQIYQDSNSLDMYHVKIPMWNNQVIIAPYNPNMFAGHFYFPAYKEERVLVGFDFRKAWIKNYLDWRPGARLPMDTQGNHLLFGKTATSDETSMNHVYEDGKPVFNIKRTMAKDTEWIQMQEGFMFLQTKEES